MTTQKPYFFVSYSHRDTDIVSRVISGLNAEGIQVWRDTELKPGVFWENAIAEALKNASGLLVFISTASMQSEWVRREIESIVSRPSAPIIPVILEHVEMPSVLQNIQWFDLSKYRNIEEGTKALANELKLLLVRNHSLEINLREKDIEEIATNTAEQARGGTGAGVTLTAQPPDSVFIVHGRDFQLLSDVENYLFTLKVKPIVLSKIQTSAASLFQKFSQISSLAQFAVILITDDDLGALQQTYSNGGQAALQYRARQNVILELGFFWGYLGWDRVFILKKDNNNPPPYFEMPSDVQGVLYSTVDPTNAWQSEMRIRLRQANFNV